MELGIILPRLAAMASANNHVTNETKRTDIAKQLFEAYSAISCCYAPPVLSEQLVAEAMLPGLRCLKLDMEALGAEHLEVVNAMIRDYQSKLDINSIIKMKSCVQFSFNSCSVAGKLWIETIEKFFPTCVYAQPYQAITASCYHHPL
ncbi:hypothetical protein Btru_011368 [Bulinus truncatus]|nr:hypothetical protein Btru_011368 [Bulinus truncatus]